jgi:Flp pilus assembly protein TadB
MEAMIREIPLYLKEAGLNAMYGALCGYFFYRNIYITGILTMIFCFRGYLKGRKLEIKVMESIDENHFYEFLIELAEGLDAGNNIINALGQIHDKLPCGRVRDKLKEAIIKLGLNKGMDEVFSRFGDSFSGTVIASWSRIIILSFNNGADLQKAIRENRDLFVLKRRTKREIESIVARQRFSFLIIKFMPFLILSILVGSFGEFSAVLYGSSGRIIMSIALLMILSSEFIAEKILRI